LQSENQTIKQTSGTGWKNMPVEGIDISPLQSVLREKQSIFQHNKIGALKLSGITEQLARHL
jgi:hypothetical protein